MIIEQLIQKYNLNKNSYDITNFDKEVYTNLIKKWESYISRGHYGFDLSGTSNVWLTVVDELLEYCKINFPEFKILQIKLKYGGICIYLSGIDYEFQKELYNLEKELFDERLIW